MEGLILSPVPLTPVPNAQGGTAGSKDPLTKAALFQAASVSPGQKSLKSEGLHFHSLSFLGPPDHPIQSFNLCNAFNNT